MIEIGQWVGQYKFEKEVHQKMSGFESTNFELEVIKADNNNFFGKIQDDLSTGGTEGVGEIIGKISGEKIEFIKQMPIMTLMVGKNGTRETLNKKHRKIYYQGIFSSDRKSISGQWRFKFGFIWLGIIPIPVSPTKGTWTMKLKE